MPRAKPSIASEAVALGLHDLAQPLSAALLSVETALLLLDRRELEAGRERVAAASDRLTLANRLLHAVRIAGGARPGPWRAAFDMAEVLHAVWAGLRLPPLCHLQGDRGFIEAALAGLALVFSPRACRAAASPRGGLRIRLVGSASEPALLPVWLRALRRAGIEAASRRSGGEVCVMLTIGPEAGADGRRGGDGGEHPVALPDQVTPARDAPPRDTPVRP